MASKACTYTLKGMTDHNQSGGKSSTRATDEAWRCIQRMWTREELKESISKQWLQSEGDRGNCTLRYMQIYFIQISKRVWILCFFYILLFLQNLDLIYEDKSWSI